MDVCISEVIEVELLVRTFAKIEDGVICFTDGLKQIKTKKSFYVHNNILRDHIVCPVDDMTYILHHQGSMYAVRAKYNHTTKQLYIQKGAKGLQEFLKKYLDYTNKYKQELALYLSNDKEPILCTLSPRTYFCHWGHALIDGYSAFFSFIDTYPVKYVYGPKDVRANAYFLKETDIFNNNLYDITLRDFIDDETLFLETCKENLYFFSWAGHHISGPVFPEKVKHYLQNVLYADKEVDNLLKNKKVVLFVGKCGCRYAINQGEAYNLAIKYLKQKYSNVIFLYQGYIQGHAYQDYTTKELLTSGGAAHFQQEEIFNQMSRGHSECVINLHGKKISEYAAYVKHVDFYVSPYGSVQHLAHAFSKYRGLVYCALPTREFIQKIFTNTVEVLFTESIIPSKEDRQVSSFNRNMLIDLDKFQEVIETITL